MTNQQKYDIIWVLVKIIVETTNKKITNGGKTTMRKYATNFYEYEDTARECKAVKAVTTYGGKSVSAVALTAPGDTYDVDTGKKIANLRLDIKIANKREKSMLTRAQRYGTMIEQYREKIATMRKEMNRALEAAADRRVEASEYEAQLDALLKTL